MEIKLEVPDEHSHKVAAFLAGLLQEEPPPEPKRAWQQDDAKQVLRQLTPHEMEIVSQIVERKGARVLWAGLADRLTLPKKPDPERDCPGLAGAAEERRLRFPLEHGGTDGDSWICMRYDDFRAFEVAMRAPKEDGAAPSAGARRQDLE